MLEDWCVTGVDLGGARCLHELVTEQAARTPERIAVSAGEQTLTYAELEAEANRLAHHLTSLGAQPEQRVAVFVDRSLPMVTAILGILKSGAAYVPLDTSYPRERLEHMLALSNCAVIVTDRSLAPRLPVRGARPLYLDDPIAGPPAPAPAARVRPEGLAYVIFTSGSSGQPKGVMVSHAAIVNRLLWMQHALPLDGSDVVLQKTPISFDASIWELFVPLLAGARLFLAEPGGHKDSAYLAATVARRGITVLQLVPSILHAFLAADEIAGCGHLRRLFCGGEALSGDLVEQCEARLGAEVHNLYGPTETAIDATHWWCAEGPQPRMVPIGRPVANAKVYLLDGEMAPVPVGAVGEIYVGGAGLARGYLDRPDLTAASFLPDPFDRTGGGRLYRTGDGARWRPSGVLEFLGRRDNQVKIRGVRVELEEIEALLQHCPGVAKSVVTAPQDRNGERRLVAYIVPRADRPPTVEELWQWSRLHLPDAMQPTAWVQLSVLPRSASGKIDRAALPAPDAPLRPAVPFVAPAGMVEETLAAIWGEVLQVDSLSVHDNFFTLGGDSILSLQIISRAAQRGIALTAKQMFQYQTIAEQAAVAQIVQEKPREQGPVTGWVLWTPVQRRFLALDLPNPQHWNQSVLLATRARLEPQRLSRAFELLLAHHDALRLRVEKGSGEPRQLVAPPGDAPPLLVVDLESLPEPARAEAVSDAASQVQRSLNLAAGPLLRPALFRASTVQAERLLIVAHHLAVDGVSWRILLRDLETVYRRLGGEPVDLPPKTTSFQEWAERLVEHAGREELLAELAYWRAAAGAPAPLPLDLPLTADGNREGSARNVEVALDEEETSSLLRAAPRGYRLQLAEVLLTALLRAARRWTGHGHLAIDLEGHGREDLFAGFDLSRTVGWFTCVYPVHLALPAEDEAGAQLKAVKEQLRRVPGHGVGYGLLRYLSSFPEAEALAAGAAPQVSFNYLGQFDATLGELSLLAPAGEPGGANRDAAARRAYLLEINSGISEGRLRLSFNYSVDAHRRATIEALAVSFLAELRTLLEHLQSPQAYGYTPADFPLAGLDEAALARIVGEDRDVEDIYPLSPLQRGLLSESLEKAGSGVYFQQLSCRLLGPLDADLFAHAWQQAVDRHPTLRTAFVWERLAKPMQVVREHATLAVGRFDWRDRSAEARRAGLRELMESENRKGFDLRQPPLMRLWLIHVAEEEHQMVWSHHHMLLDGWSVPVLVQEVFACYEALRYGEAVQLPRPRPYRDFIAWLQEQELTVAESFWRRLLRGFRTPTPLGIECSGRVTKPEHRRYAEASMRFSEPASDGFHQFVQRHRLTLNSLLQGGWAALLGRYSGEPGVVFGAVSAGRPATLAGVDKMLGLFINTLPVRVAMPNGEPAVDWLLALQEQQAEARQFEHTPLPQVHAWSEIHLGTPLFESLFVFENYPVRDLVAEQAKMSLSIADVRFEDRNSYPLSVLSGPGAQVSLRVAYDESRFDSTTAQRLLGHFATLLRELTADAGRPVTELPLLDAVERQQLLVEVNATTAPTIAGRTLHGLFEAQAARTPDSVALVAGNQRVSYRELDAKARCIAHYLEELGVGPEVPVGIFLRRTPAMVAALLGVLKAGGAYMGLDPDLPASRIEFMLADAGSTVVITEWLLRDRLPGCGAQLVGLEAIPEPAEPLPVTEPRPYGDLAYLIYTSGSTGRPKGVAIEHRSAVALMDWAAGVFRPAELAGVLAGSSIGFDLSVFEIFATLTLGGMVILADSTLALHTLANASQVTLVNTVPTVLAGLLRQGGLPPSVRVVCTAGETLPQNVAEEVYRTTAVETLYNLYGPTEDTTYSTWTPVERDISRPPSIGRPFPNTRVYLLDRWLEPVPAAVAGEVFLAGDGLARGYLGRPALTAERFLPDQFGGPGERMYRTGDLARWLPDGRLDFVARTDHQVKIRGYRIELGEIEAVLQEHPDVAGAVVLVQQEATGEKVLVAYFTARQEPPPTAQQLRTFARRQLPDPMVPGRMIRLPELPRTANGKVDRDALARPAEPAKASKTHGYTAPRSVLEEVLAEMWAELLRCERVGIDDDFFDLGGDSLLAVQLMARLRATFPAELTASALFSSSTVAQLAQALVAHETRPGEMEKTAAILQRVRSLSPEERSRLLAAKSAAVKEGQPR